MYIIILVILLTETVANKMMNLIIGTVGHSVRDTYCDTSQTRATCGTIKNKKNNFDKKNVFK